MTSIKEVMFECLVYRAACLQATQNQPASLEAQANLEKAVLLAIDMARPEFICQVREKSNALRLRSNCSCFIKVAVPRPINGRVLVVSKGSMSISCLTIIMIQKESGASPIGMFVFQLTHPLCLQHAYRHWTCLHQFRGGSTIMTGVCFQLRNFLKHQLYLCQK